MSARAERIADATEDVWEQLQPGQRALLLDNPAEGLQLVKDNLTACGFDLDDDAAEEVFRLCAVSAAMDQVPRVVRLPDHCYEDPGTEEDESGRF